MRRFPNSDDDRLFSGHLDPDDAAPEVARIAGLIRAAKAPGDADELVGEELIVSQMVTVVRESRRSATAHSDRHHVLAKMLSAKVIGASAAVLLSGGIAAAATGALPTPVQEAVPMGSSTSEFRSPTQQHRSRQQATWERTPRALPRRVRARARRTPPPR